MIIQTSSNFDVVRTPKDPFKEGKQVFSDMLPRVVKCIEAESTTSAPMRKLLEMQQQEKICIS